MKFSLVVAVNDRDLLKACLLASPCLQGSAEVLVKEGFSSAGEAYNGAWADVTGDVIVFLHQDVFLGRRFLESLENAVVALDRRDPGWGVGGLFGMDGEGQARGFTYSVGLGKLLGRPFSEVTHVRALDEFVLFCRRERMFRFGGRELGFHLYGTDICLKAEAEGRKNYVVPAFAVHNSNGLRGLPRSYWRAYLHMRRTWWDRLPVVTPCAVLDRSVAPMVAGILRGLWVYKIRGRQVGKRSANPMGVYSDLEARGVLEPPRGINNPW